jgi:hypothetical protein
MTQWNGEYVDGQQLSHLPAPSIERDPVPPHLIDRFTTTYDNPFTYEDGYQEGYAQGRRHGFDQGVSFERDHNWFPKALWFLIGMCLGGIWMGVMVGWTA